ncbi:secreted effector protein PipB2 [Azospirillaceae bacterium]
MASQTETEIAAINNELIIHGKWLKKLGGRPADLSFRDLSGLNFRKARLINAKLTGVNLSGADLSGSDLSGADLFGADLEGANLAGANLTGTDFRGANLHRAVLTNAVLRGADFRVGQNGGNDVTTRLTEAKMESAILCEANLTGCDLSGADLNDADFEGADLSKAVLLGAELSGANLDNVKFGGAVIDVSRLSPTQRAQTDAGGGVTEPTYTPLSAEKTESLVAAHELWISSGGRSGRRLDLEGVDITGKSFIQRDLSGARLRRCRLKGLDMSGLKMNMADLSYSDLQDSILDETLLRGTNFRRANLTRARMAGSNLDAMPLESGNRVWPTNLNGAILHDADLTNASFANAIMHGADVGGCLLLGTKLRGVDLNAIKRSPWSPEGCGPKERRKMRRFLTPILVTTTPFGTFNTRDWSFGGLCLEGDFQTLTERGQTFTLHITTESGVGPQQPIQVFTTAIHPQRHMASFRIVTLEDNIKVFFNSLLPEKYRKK